jgi:4-hydroxy-2-oxoheptanedioate aldolase
MKPNALRALLREDRTSFGVVVASGSPLMCESLARAGFDWLMIDTEHAPTDGAALMPLLQAASLGNATPLVRVASCDPVAIMQALDAGAYGVVVPAIQDAASAERAASACRYPPRGVRGVGPYRAALYGGPDYLFKANDEMLCILQVESLDGVQAIDEILSVAEVDAVMVGPADLAMSMGLPPAFDSDDGQFRYALGKVLDACKRHAIVPGIFCAGAEQALARAREGWRLLSAGVDTHFVAQGAGRVLAELNEDSE